MNEVVQNIKFHKSRLNWDADTSLMGEGESKYYLNTIPEDSEHAGVRTSCLGTTQSTVYLPNTGSTFITVTQTNPTTSTEKFEFTLSSVPQILELTLVLDGELKLMYVSGTGYATVPSFLAGVVSMVRRYFERDLTAYGVVGSTVSFTFTSSSPAETGLVVRSMVTATYPTTLSVIGSYYDSLSDHTYYWVYDTENIADKRYLLLYVRYNDVIINIPINNSLGGIVVNNNSYVSNPFIVGEALDRLLYWCYNNLTTYKINIISHLLANSVSATPDSSALALAKGGYYSGITGDDNAVSSASLESAQNANSYFQIMSRIRALGGERSTFSPIYPLAYPSEYGENSVGVRGRLANKLYTIKTTTAFSTSEVDAIEYAVKTGDGNWRLSNLEESGDNVLLTGGEPSSDLATSDVTKLFDYVPQRHGTQCLVNNNRLVVADCTEGYDNVPLSSTITYTEDTGHISAPTIYKEFTFSGGGTYLVTPLTVSATEWRSHCFYIGVAGREYFAYVQDDSGMTQTQLCDSLAASINYEIENDNDGVDWQYDPALLPLEIRKLSASRSGTDVRIVTTLSGLTCRYMVFRSYLKQRTIKHGSKPYFGVVYSDGYGRCGGVNPCEAQVFDRGGGDDYPTDATITLANESPAWAVRSQLFYGGTNIMSYRQAVIKREDIDLEYDVIRIYINNYVVNSQVINSESQMASYVFNPGDKFLFLGYKSTDTISLEGQTFTYTTFPYFSSFIVCDILSQDESGIIIRTPGDSTLLSQIDGCTYAKIEIFTPRTDAPIEYRETPYTSDVSSVQFSSVVFDHLINQTFYIDNGIPISAWIESESFSNYFESKTLGLGRANFYNSGFKQMRRNILRASNVYIPNTNINGLSTFDWNDEVAVDEQYGFITDLKMVGGALKIIQPRKISSMYIGAEVGIDASGNQVMFRSDKVLTEPRYGATDFGSMHPESIVPHGSYLYGYDAINSVVWRDTPGGTFAISDNAMRSYFKYKTRQLVASCGYSFKAVGGYDYLNEMYLITFKDPYNSANDETIGFHEPSESWYSFYSFKPEMYCGVPGGYLLSFNGGKLYTHNSATRNNFYTTQYYSEAWVVGNIYPDDTKKWNSLVVNSNDAWSAPEIIVDEDSIAHLDGESYTTHKGKMQSLLNEIHFRIMNGEYRAEFLRDLLTSDPDTITPLDAINGRALTGKTILIKLRNANTIAVYLRGVKVNAQIAR
jgi:hypothetical protein